MRALHGDVSLLCVVLSLTNIAKFMEGNAERTWYSVRSKTSEQLYKTLCLCSPQNGMLTSKFGKITVDIHKILRELIDVSL